MCEWCDENNGEPIGCQDCGMMICLDHNRSDDVISQPYVTTEGDVYCLRCGSRNQRAIEEMEEIEAEEYGWDFYPSDWYDPSSPVSELEPEETPRYKYIGEGSEADGTQPQTD